MAFYDHSYDLVPGGYGFMDRGYGHSHYGREYDREPYYGREYDREPYYGREYDREPYFHAARGMYGRHHAEPYFDNYRRDYHRGGGYSNGRFGVLHPEEMVGRVGPMKWMDDGYRHGGYQGGYRINRRDFHGGQHYGHGNFRHLAGEYDRGDHHVLHRQEVELYVPLCCDKCVRRLERDLRYMPGVDNITMDQFSKRVVVTGDVDPEMVLERARLNKPEADFWDPRFSQ